MFIMFSACKEKIEYGDINLTEKIKRIEISTLKKDFSKYNKDTLRIKGNLTLGMGNTCINSEGISIWINNLKPAVNIDFIFGDNFHKKINNKSVELIGVYKYGKAGNLNLYDGEFTKILYIKTK